MKRAMVIRKKSEGGTGKNDPEKCQPHSGEGGTLSPLLGWRLVIRRLVIRGGGGTPTPLFFLVGNRGGVPPPLFFGLVGKGGQSEECLPSIPSITEECLPSLPLPL